MGAHAQDAAFALVEAMLRSGLVSHWLKKALLTWILKPNGGLRGLSLLEELLKAVEATLTRRLEATIRSHPQGRVLASSNVGFQKGRGAILVLDGTADFWDEARQRSDVPMAHIPWDYVTYFDRIDLAVPDAVKKARGVPENAARFFTEIHGTSATLTALTPWARPRRLRE